jgi:hypothetical protein
VRQSRDQTGRPDDCIHDRLVPHAHTRRALEVALTLAREYAAALTTVTVQPHLPRYGGTAATPRRWTGFWAAPLRRSAGTRPRSVMITR